MLWDELISNANKKGIKKVESYGVIGVPRPPIILEFEENNQMLGL